MKPVPRQRWHGHAVLFEKLLEIAGRAGGLCLDRTMDKEIDPGTLAQPTLDVTNPFFEKRLVALPVRTTDEAHETAWRCHAGLQRQFGLAPLYTHLRVVRTSVNRTAIQQHASDAEPFQDRCQGAGMRLAKPVRVADFHSQRCFTPRPGGEKSGEIVEQCRPVVRR